MIFIDTKETGAAYHFALEQYLCEEKQMDDIVFFLWQTPPTLMLGNFQNTYQEINYELAQEEGVAVVRRLSGGGTIYTDFGCFQFSFIKKSTSDTIDFSHYLEIVITALGKMGVKAEYNSRNDLAIEGRKISGNAQSSRCGYTIHHGSLLFNADFSKMSQYLTPPPYKLASKGISSVRERTANIIDYLPNKLSTEEFYQELKGFILQEEEVTEYHLTEDDQLAVNTIADSRFTSWDWNFGKNPAFNIEKRKKCPGGWLEISLDVSKGKIISSTISGDFFAMHELDKIESILEGCYFAEEAVSESLSDEIIKASGLYNIEKQDIIDCLFH